MTPFSTLKRALADPKAGRQITATGREDGYDAGRVTVRRHSFSTYRARVLTTTARIAKLELLDQPHKGCKVARIHPSQRSYKKFNLRKTFPSTHYRLECQIHCRFPCRQKRSWLRELPFTLSTATSSPSGCLILRIFPSRKLVAVKSSLALSVLPCDTRTTLSWKDEPIKCVDTMLRQRVAMSCSASPRALWIFQQSKVYV